MEKKNHLGITLYKSNFSKKDWKNICNAFVLPKKTKDIYFQPENIVSTEPKEQN